MIYGTSSMAGDIQSPLISAEQPPFFLPSSGEFPASVPEVMLSPSLEPTASLPDPMVFNSSTNSGIVLWPFRASLIQFVI